MGAFPSAWQGRALARGEREAAMVAPPAAHHSTVLPCFYGSLGLLHKHSWLRISSLLSPQAVSSHPTAVLHPGLRSNPHIPALSQRVHQQTHVPVWGTQGCGMDHLRTSHSVLSATDWPFHPPPTASDAPLLSQLISSSVREIPRMQEPLLCFISPPGTQIPSCFLSSSLSLLSFVLPSYVGIFLVLSGVQGLLLVFSQYSVRIVPCVDVFLMHL